MKQLTPEQFVNLSIDLVVNIVEIFNEPDDERQRDDLLRRVFNASDIDDLARIACNASWDYESFALCVANACNETCDDEYAYFNALGLSIDARDFDT